MFWKTLLFVIFLCAIFHASGSSISKDLTREKRQAYAITNSDIHKSIKRVENKLARHEYREAQLGVITTKTLKALNIGQVMTKRDLHIISKQLAKMEEKMFAIESLIKTTDERQRYMMKGLSQGLNLLISKSNINALPPPPLPELPPKPSEHDVAEELKNVIKTISTVDHAIRNDVKKVNNEIKIVGEALNQHMDQLRTRHDSLWSDFNTCNTDRIKSLSKVTGSLTSTGKIFNRNVNEAKKLLKRLDSKDDCGALVNNLAQSLKKMDKAQQISQKENLKSGQHIREALDDQKQSIEHLLEETKQGRDILEMNFGTVFDSLQKFDESSSSNLERVESTIQKIIQENSEKINNGINSVASTLKLKATNIIDALEDSSDQRENMKKRLEDNFKELTHEIRGLKKVEQVMISTADAVLDTKRSIEFGIQQVIIELSDVVRHSGSTINSTLSEKINDISFAILKNQTSALTNMTKKMEREISQVWRQIGVMYQQVSQSVNMLDDLQSSTSKHMNASLSKVDSMDGTVGKINSKVAGVEDDLNYLLGRLSLVVSEFSQLKSGVGQELDRLRDMAQEFSRKDIVEYKVETKT